MNLPKTYQPDQYEPNIYALWETSGAFAPKGEGEPYSIIMPPPNLTGELHLGHALTDTTEGYTRYLAPESGLRRREGGPRRRRRPVQGRRGEAARRLCAPAPRRRTHRSSGP